MRGNGELTEEVKGAGAGAGAVVGAGGEAAAEVGRAPRLRCCGRTVK